MQRIKRSTLLGLFLLPALAVLAESKNPADYPLRIHIYSKDSETFYSHRSVDESKGEGRANLFENGEAHGVDFSYECSEKLKSSFGYETYPAKWRKPGKTLVVLLPVFGKTGQFWTCDLKTDVKNFAYTRHNGVMGMESVAEFKSWMLKHEYDPEHGKDMPVKTNASDPQAEPPAAPAPSQP